MASVPLSVAKSITQAERVELWRAVIRALTSAHSAAFTIEELQSIEALTPAEATPEVFARMERASEVYRERPGGQYGRRMAALQSFNAVALVFRNRA